MSETATPDKPKPDTATTTQTSLSDDFTININDAGKDNEALAKELEKTKKQIAKMQTDTIEKEKSSVIAQLKELKVDIKDLNKEGLPSLQLLLKREQTRSKTRKLGEGESSTEPEKIGTGYYDRITQKWVK